MTEFLLVNSMSRKIELKLLDRLHLTSFMYLYHLLLKSMSSMNQMRNSQASTSLLAKIVRDLATGNRINIMDWRLQP